MKTETAILIGSIVIFLMAGCVTSTTTSTATFEKSEDAAIQNYTLGARYYQNGNYDIARQRLERALELDPKMAQAHYTLAMTHEQLGNPQSAAQHYKRAVRVDPSNFDARNAYAVFLCRQRRFKDAVKQFDSALKITSNDTSHVIYTNAGACMTQKPDFEQAESYFRSALKVRPIHAEALIQMAALKFKTKECLQSRAFLQRFLASNTTSPGVLYLGVQVEGCLEDDRAETDYMNQLLREFPDSPEARRVVAAD